MKNRDKLYLFDNKEVYLDQLDEYSLRVLLEQTLEELEHLQKQLGLEKGVQGQKFKSK